MAQRTILVGDGALSLEALNAVAVHHARIELATTARERMQRARELVERMASGERPVYGVSTGFGSLAEIKIPHDQIAVLQRNLILSHSAGLGNPLSRAETRAMMALRAQTLAAGFSGVRVEVVQHVLTMLNHGVHPRVPEKGSVGASGDLAPLAHLTLGMLGEGEAEYDGTIMPARAALERADIAPLVLQAKEGLSLVNGTQAMAALGTLSQLQSESLTDTADIAGAMTLEGMAGLPMAFDPRIMQLRPHAGALRSAEHLRLLCHNSGLYQRGNSGKVQDPYSLRCMPQVHGASRDALAFCRSILEQEINSVTDNPLVFCEENEILSGGNFHGQPLALALDFAAMAVAELANIAERRVEQLLNPTLSGLPAFLVNNSGIHSGYMIAQLTAAALVNENKILCTPASVDSIPGNASREDHVSMGMTSARKLREVVTNTRAVLAIELLCGAQAIDLRASKHLGDGARAAHHCIREHVPFLDADRHIARDIEAVIDILQSGTLLQSVRAAVPAH